MGDVTKQPPLSDLPGADLFPETLELPLRARESADPGAEGEDAVPLRSMRETGSLPLVTDLHRVIPPGVQGRAERAGQDLEERPRLVGNRYRIVGDAGEGASANVYKAVHLYLGKSFALKAVHQGVFDDPDAEQSFLREARVLSQLHHPNIIQVTDFGTDARFGAYLVAEYLYGETLEQRMARSKRLSVAFSLHLALQIAEALHYMHQQKLIHCDVKPENLFLCDPPRGVRQRPIPKLIDFGLSHSIAHGTGRDGVGVGVGGTPLYAAPEQLAGQPPHPSMDIYAVGTLLYEMITGALPYEGKVADLMELKRLAPPPSPSVHMEKPLEDRLVELILRALRPEPEERQQNMGRLVFELRTVMDMLGIPRASGRRGAIGSSAARRGARRRRAVRQTRIPHPFPMFQLDLQGRTIAASSSFLMLVGVKREALRGLTLGQTLLANVYPDIDADLARAMEADAPLQRTLTFETDDGRPASLLLWVVPQLDRTQAVECYAGVVVPLPV